MYVHTRKLRKETKTQIGMSSTLMPVTIIRKKSPGGIDGVTRLHWCVAAICRRLRDCTCNEIQPRGVYSPRDVGFSRIFQRGATIMCGSYARRALQYDLSPGVDSKRGNIYQRGLNAGSQPDRQAEATDSAARPASRPSSSAPLVLSIFILSHEWIVCSRIEIEHL